MDELTHAVYSALDAATKGVGYDAGTLIFASRLMVDRLRAGGISDLMIEKCICGEPTVGSDQ